MASDMSESSTRCLTSEQLQRCVRALSVRLAVDAQFPNMPSIDIPVARFLEALYESLLQHNIPVDVTYLEGSAASACLSDEPLRYNDLDIVFHLSSDASFRDLCRVRDVLLNCLRSLSPALAYYDPHLLASCYVSKMFLTPEGQEANDDQWALFTFVSGYGAPALDLKFVRRINRPFQFSIDSFQIGLDAPFLAAVASSNNGNAAELAVPYRCQYGDFDQALSHLKEKQIAVACEDDVTRIYGGGLLKYAALLRQGYVCAPNMDTSSLERYMCTRFQLDFPVFQMSRFGLPAPYQRIRDFVCTHMPYSPDQQLQYLDQLSAIVCRAVGTKTGLTHNIEVLKQHVKVFLNPHPIYSLGRPADPQTISLSLPGSRATEDMGVLRRDRSTSPDELSSSWSSDEDAITRRPSSKWIRETRGSSFSSETDDSSDADCEVVVKAARSSFRKSSCVGPGSIRVLQPQPFSVATGSLAGNGATHALSAQQATACGRKQRTGPGHVPSSSTQQHAPGLLQERTNRL